MRNIIKCFLTVTPNEKFYNFIKQLPDIEYIYICIDNNDYNIPNYDGKIKIIKINNNESIVNGFHSTLTSIGEHWNGKAGSRDKALYYFYKNNINYDYIWFIEEDVFIPTIETITNIDMKYPDNDLLINGKGECIINKICDHWHWPRINKHFIDNKILPPYSCTMICAIRCSKKMLECIFNHAVKYKTLFLDEAMFTTLALHNNLNVKKIEELDTILWGKEWTKNEININNLYHPVKSIEDQYEFRNYLQRGEELNSDRAIVDDTHCILSAVKKKMVWCADALQKCEQVDDGILLAEFISKLALAAKAVTDVD